MHITTTTREINVIDDKLNVISYTVNYPTCDKDIIDPIISNGMTEYDLIDVSLQNGLFFIHHNEKDWFKRTGPCSCC